MDAERFRDLAAAYGADPRRWPPDERAAARAFLAADRRAERLLFEARLLDAALDASAAPPASAALRDRVIADAARAGLTPRPQRRVGGFSPLAWLSGAGWAAAGAAGVAIGLSSGAALSRDLQAEAVLEHASAPALDDMEILG